MFGVKEKFELDSDPEGDSHLFNASHSMTPVECGDTLLSKPSASKVCEVCNQCGVIACLRLGQLIGWL